MDSSYKQLLRRSQEPCDFCDRIFKNKLESIVHNASHIIIPLLKQNYYQCDVCLHYFESQEELDNHQKIKHLKLANNSQKSNNKFNFKVKFENSDDEFDKDEKSSFKHVVEGLVESNFKDTIRNCRNSMQSTPIKLENESDCYLKEQYNGNKSLEIKKEPIKIEDSRDDDKINNGTENDYNGYCINKAESIKSRLRFEGDDDLFHNNILSDFITECNVKVFNEPIKQMPGFNNHNSQNGINNVNNYHGQWIQNNDIMKSKNQTDACNDLEMDDYEFDNFVIRNGQNVDNGVPEPIYKSVHYTDLTKPGLFICKYCCRSFPNRLLQIQHEPVHINIRKPRPLLCTHCDKYIAGNYIHLRLHIHREHPGADVEKKHHTHKCQQCGLKFRKYMAHVKNYHPYDCHGCGKEYGKKELTNLNEHIHNCVVQNVSSKILNVCGLCFSFVKVKINLKYILMGTTVNEPGVRYPCAMCGKKYFELKTIKRIIYGANLNVRDYYKCRERKPMSNEERLKKFQHRLKRINLLNKFYSVILFFQTRQLAQEQLEGCIDHYGDFSMA